MVLTYFLKLSTYKTMTNIATAESKVAVVANHRVLAAFAPPLPHVAGIRYLPRMPFLTFEHFAPTFVKGCSDMCASWLRHSHDMTVGSHPTCKAIDGHRDLDRPSIDIFWQWIGIFGREVRGT